jgi:hypothetical protein
MSNFDPASFASQSFTGANDTKIVPLPIGEYTGVTKDQEIGTWQSKDDPTKAGLKLTTNILVDGSQSCPSGKTVKEETGRDSVTLKYDCLLDIVPGPDGRYGLDFGKGKNVGLGRLREALNLNDPSTPFAFQQIPGRMVKIAVGHRPYKGDLFAEINAVTKP